MKKYFSVLPVFKAGVNTSFLIQHSSVSPAQFPLLSLPLQADHPQKLFPFPWILPTLDLVTSSPQA